MSSTWPAINIAKPEWSGSGTGFAQDARDHLLHMRAALAAGAMWGWSETPSGGTEEQPAVMTYINDPERIRATITWGTTGGAAGNPTAIAYEYSDDGGATWAAIGTLNFAWTAAGNSNGTTWS